MAAIAVIVSGCASAPKVPQWVLQTPQPDSKYTFFVGSSSGTDSATTIGDATASLVAGIMKYMGVSISVSSSAEAKASLSDYQAQITQTVKTESQGRIAGFEVVEKYINKDAKSGLYTVHVLARYETKELQKEKARLEALFKEKFDAVAVPEQKGDAAAAEGRQLDAIRFYAEAMTAAAGSDIDNAQIKLERNAKKASSIAATLMLSIVSGSNSQIPLGGSLPTITARLTTNHGGTSQPVAGAPLSIAYPKKLSSGRVGTATTQAFTDTNGDAAFTLKAIDIAGEFRVSVQIDFASISDLFSSLPSWALPYSDAVEADLSSKVAYANYSVVSAAKNIPLAIAVRANSQQAALTLDLSTFSLSLKEALVKQGFVLADAASPSSSAPDIAQLRALAPPNMQRFALASIDIGAVSKDGDYFIASVSGSMNVYDLANGTTLYSASKSAQGMGASERDALSNALRTLAGQVFANDILGTLP